MAEGGQSEGEPAATAVDSSRNRLLALGGASLVLMLVIFGGWSILRSEDQPDCEPPGPVLETAVDAIGVDWQPLADGGPTNSVSWIRGDVPGPYPSVICEKTFLDSPVPGDAVNNVSIHRYPLADIARSEFPTFFQDNIDYGTEIEPGHRFRPDDRRRSAHLLSDSCLVISVTWEADNDWDPQQRHAVVLDALQPLDESGCPAVGGG